VTGRGAGAGAGGATVGAGVGAGGGGETCRAGVGTGAGATGAIRGVAGAGVPSSRAAPEMTAGGVLRDCGVINGVLVMAAPMRV
jgi:hypothetical protein